MRKKRKGEEAAELAFKVGNFDLNPQPPQPAVRCSRCGEACVELRGVPWGDRFICPMDQTAHFQDGSPGQA